MEDELHIARYPIHSLCLAIWTQSYFLSIYGAEYRVVNSVSVWVWPMYMAINLGLN
jgi:hypothetical protein